MKDVLTQFDLYPLVFPVGEPTELTLKPLHTRKHFTGTYKVTVHQINAGTPRQEFSAWNSTEYTCQTEADGCLRLTYTAAVEGEHFVRVWKDDQKEVQMAFYALDTDLACRYPLRGDLHMHSCRSDGQEEPPVVCANYRAKGYDFIVMTDHHRYYPSLEAMEAFRGVKTALNILPGEEVHLPGTDVHIVNAGGLYSVNGLLESSPNYRDTNGELEKRRLNSDIAVPDTMTLEAYEAQIDALEAKLKPEIPENVNSRWYAVCQWAFDRIRESGGLGIFAHPYWISDLVQIPEPFTRYMLEKHPFDVFEVVGGETYFHQNGFQVAAYYDEYRSGRVHPIVGSTDSHCSFQRNRGWDICSTIVFAPKNERKAILDAIMDHYSVAVDSISKEYRLVGEFRMQKYGAFLMEYFYPIHDRQAALDGELMYQYVQGNATQEEVELISARAEALMEKYIRVAK